MNVLIIGQYFPPDLGGAATRAYNVAKGLSMNGCKVTVITAFPHYPTGRIQKSFRYRPFKVEWFGNIKIVRTFILPLISKGLFRRVLLFGSFAVSSLFAVQFVGKIDVSGDFEPEGDTEYSAAIGDANSAANIKTKNIFQNFMTLISTKLNIPPSIQWGIIGLVSILIVFMLARTILGDTRI